MAKSVPLSELDESIAALVDEAQRGEDVIITKDGAPVVKLVPVETKPAIERYMDRMRGTLTVNGDLLEPFDDIQWESE